MKGKLQVGQTWIATKPGKNVEERTITGIEGTGDTALVLYTTPSGRPGSITRNGWRHWTCLVEALPQ